MTKIDILLDILTPAKEALKAFDMGRVKMMVFWRGKDGQMKKFPLCRRRTNIEVLFYDEGKIRVLSKFDSSGQEERISWIIGYIGATLKDKGYSKVSFQVKDDSFFKMRKDIFIEFYPPQ